MCIASLLQLLAFSLHVGDSGLESVHLNLDLITFVDGHWLVQTSGRIG
jgi:hypothetical protein